MKKTMDYTEHRGYRFTNTTTLENIGSQMDVCYDSLLKIGEKVAFAPMNYKGESLAAIYEFIETPEETGLGDIECRLNLIKVSEESFKDSGSAVTWALANMN